MSSASVGAAAYAAELRKHVTNDTICQELHGVDMRVSF